MPHPLCDQFTFCISFLCEILPSYRSAKVFSLESFLLYRIIMRPMHTQSTHSMTHAHASSLYMYVDIRSIGENVDSQSRPNHFLQAKRSHNNNKHSFSYYPRLLRFTHTHNLHVHVYHETTHVTADYNHSKVNKPILK